MHEQDAGKWASVLKAVDAAELATRAQRVYEIAVLESDVRRQLGCRSVHASDPSLVADDRYRALLARLLSVEIPPSRSALLSSIPVVVVGEASQQAQWVDDHQMHDSLHLQISLNLSVSRLQQQLSEEASSSLLEQLQHQRTRADRDDNQLRFVRRQLSLAGLRRAHDIHADQMRFFLFKARQLQLASPVIGALLRGLEVIVVRDSERGCWLRDDGALCVPWNLRGTDAEAPFDPDDYEHFGGGTTSGDQDGRGRPER